jgi:hypothetical protein
VTASPAPGPPYGLALAGLVFVLLVGTANAGGYRYGVSDQAFYIPAIHLAAGTAAFPRDAAVFAPQMRLWVGDEVLGAIVRTAGVDLPPLFAILYAGTMVLLALATIALARSLGCSWWTIAAALVLLTLRHRIARTGANSLEGYFHPRMLAFACGMTAFASMISGRRRSAGIWTIAAGVVHTSTALWFAGALAVAAWWPERQSRAGRALATAGAVVAVAAVLAAVATLPRMDADWLAVLADRDYLFPADWPLYAWITNLAYPGVLWALYRRRVRAGQAVPGEAGLLAGLTALVILFLVSVPLTGLRIAFVVQLQVNRVFWLLDAVTAVYLAWWVLDAVAIRRRRLQPMVVGGLALLALGRGAFILHDTGRPLARLTAAADPAWLDAADWLRAQPGSWHVLADPAHAWRFGISLRAAALRDTPLEAGKDPAMAMYDRALAGRVREYTALLAGFDDWTDAADIRRVDERLALDAFIDMRDRHFDLPVLYRNDRFVIYDLR